MRFLPDSPVAYHGGKMAKRVKRAGRKAKSNNMWNSILFAGLQSLNNKLDELNNKMKETK